MTTRLDLTRFPTCPGCGQLYIGSQCPICFSKWSVTPIPRAQEAPTPPPYPKPTQGSGKKPRQAKEPNKTEADFHRILESRQRHGEFETIMFEGCKLRIGPNCYYSPDFMAINYEGRVTFFEVKGGHIWDDSKVKFKAAKEKHSWAKFQMWQRKRSEWRQIA